MFINVPKRYNFDNPRKLKLEELIVANWTKKPTAIQQWPDEKLIENGR